MRCSEFCFTSSCLHVFKVLEPKATKHSFFLWTHLTERLFQACKLRWTLLKGHWSQTSHTRAPWSLSLVSCSTTSPTRMRFNEVFTRCEWLWNCLKVVSYSTRRQTLTHGHVVVGNSFLHTPFTVHKTHVPNLLGNPSDCNIQHAMGFFQLGSSLCSCKSCLTTNLSWRAPQKPHFSDRLGQLLLDAF